MKFKLLSIGQKFEYNGELYIKTSALIANNVDSGHNKMIPAYATLKLLDPAITEKEISKKDKLESERVIAAFNEFYATCLSLIEDKTALDLARDKFLQSIT